MIAELIPFRGPNFAREALLMVLEAEVRADRLPPHVVDVMSTLLSAPAALAQIIQQPTEQRHAIRAHV